MAKSGYLNTNAYEGRYLQFAWTARDPDTTNLKTTIDWTIKGAGTGQAGYYYAGYFGVSIDGNSVYSKGQYDRIKLYNGTQVASGSYTFTHNEDGSRNFTVYIQAGIYTYAVNCTGSTTFTLDPIARASQPSLVTWPESTANVGDFGETFSIHMNRKSSDFTHTVRYEYGSRKGTIATNVETGTTWAVPLSFMNDIPEDTSASGRIYVDTYNGSTLIGTKYTGFTVTVPASVKPSCSATLEDVNGVDDIYGSPIASLSKIKVTVSATQAYGSPIAAYSITIDGAKYNTATATTGLLQNDGDSEVKVTVTDKRGRTSNAWTYTMRVQGYNAPSISRLTVKRCDENGTENDQGQYIQATFSASVDDKGGYNTAAYTLRYKKSSSDTWSSVNLSNLANVYDVTNRTAIFAADESSPYEVELTVKDRHRTVTRTTSASTAFSLMDWHPSGTGIRFGGVSQLENTLQNDLSLKQVGNSYAFQPGAFEGEKGYTLLAIITLTTLNVNAPIVFEINRRGALCPMWVYVRFASSSTTTDPDLASIAYEGDNFGAFMVKVATSTWKLYVDNTSGWSNPCLQSWYTTENQKARLNISFMDEQVAGTEPNVLGTYYRATPAKMQSLVDFIYPVGSIYWGYSHVSPASLFGGSWTRIENAFLWATTSGGTIGQTGGAAEHTLTQNEIPSHGHKLIRPKWYGADGDGVISTTHSASTGSIYGTSSTTPAYKTVEGNSNYGIQNTGGGQPHNNMPPYIQVSAWRRTA